MSDALEAHESAEHAEHATEPFNRKVAGTMAIIAAALAVVGILGEFKTTEELLNQQKASDQWSYYQAKSIRRYESEIARDVLAAVKGEKSAAYEANIEKYKKEGEEIQDKAKELEHESAVNGQKAVRLHFGGIFLEIGIVFASLGILAKRPSLWGASIVLAVVGASIALTTLTVK
jgi:Domain of unknown function (DUF4337)